MTFFSCLFKIKDCEIIGAFCYSVLEVRLFAYTMSSTETVSERNNILSPPKKRPKRKPLSSAEKSMILNVYKMTLELNPDSLIDDIVKKASESTGVSESSVYRVIREYKATHTLKSPKKEKSRKKLLKSVDEFDRNAIRRKVHEFFFRNELPTIDKVLSVVNEDCDLPNFRRTTFYELLKELHFKHIRRGRDSMLIDRDDIILWRRRYLRTIRSMRQEGRPIYYLDETWLNEGHIRNNVWVDDTIKSSKQAFLAGLSTGHKGPHGKGRRLIITHIGSQSGFVDGCLWFFESKKSGDYHEEMCGEAFENWFGKVLPMLETNAVIVLDNAPYHSRRKECLPTTSWKKQQISEWLESKNIPFEDGMLKKEMLEIVHRYKPQYNKYIIDEMANNDNKTVLRIPPYHCELNAIELVWAQIKGYVGARNRSYKLKDVKTLLEEAITKVTPDEWNKCVRHVIEKVENVMWKLDNIMEEREERIVISLNESSASSLESS